MHGNKPCKLKCKKGVISNILICVSTEVEKGGGFLHQNFLNWPPPVQCVISAKKWAKYSKQVIRSTYHIVSEPQPSTLQSHTQIWRGYIHFGAVQENRVRPVLLSCRSGFEHTPTQYKFELSPLVEVREL